MANFHFAAASCMLLNLVLAPAPEHKNEHHLGSKGRTNWGDTSDMWAHVAGLEVYQLRVASDVPHELQLDVPWY